MQFFDIDLEDDLEYFIGVVKAICFHIAICYNSYCK